MKREHITEQSYIEWLKSLGCVFYVPLDYNNGLKDLISGSQMQQGNNGSVTWDSNEQAWYFQDLYANVHDVVASWQNLSLPFDITNIGYTQMQEQENFYTTNMESTKSTDILILWLLAAVTAIILLVSAHTYKVAAPTMQWQSDTSWVKSWNFLTDEQ